MRRIFLLGLVLILSLVVIGCDPDNGTNVCPPHNYEWETTTPETETHTKIETGICKLCEDVTERGGNLKNNENGQITWTAIQNGSKDTEDTTKITFTFSDNIDSIGEDNLFFYTGFEYNNIYLDGKIEIENISPTNDKRIWEVSITVLIPGEVGISFLFYDEEKKELYVNICPEIQVITVYEEIDGKQVAPQYRGNWMSSPYRAGARILLERKYFPLNGGLLEAWTVDNRLFIIFVDTPAMYIELNGTFVDNNGIIELIVDPDFVWPEWRGTYIKQ